MTIKKQAKVILVTNHKGGVGKTTNCIQLAGAFAEQGKKSLIIDLDATGGATESLKVPMEGWVSSFEMLTGTDIEAAICTEKDEEIQLPPNIHLVPSSKRLESLDDFLTQNKWTVLQDMLVGPINKVREDYDYIWIDTPPQTRKQVIPALKASDFALLSCMPDDLSVRKLGDALSDIRDAQQGPNPDLVVLGVIMNSVSRPVTRLARAIINEVERACPNLKFKTEISRTVVVQEATKMGQTVFQYEPGHAVSQEYRDLAKEVEQRIESFISNADVPAKEAGEISG